MWTLINTAATDTFNGISAPNNNFAIAVGENGKIVHFLAGDSGTVMPSGSTEELFDVYASSADLAVATGKNVVLLWDGMSWSTLRTETDDTVFTGTWISPEQDIILYGFIASGFGGFVCPKIPNDETELFCRGFLNELMLTACGNSDDIKLFTTTGDIYHLNNFLGDVSGPDPIHDEPIGLSLDGVWIPEGSCIPGSIAPLEAFAIKNFPTGDILHFDGSSWVDMNVTVPADHTLTWIGGVGSNNVFAVGFKPNNMGGNAGVVWHYDGTTWTEDLTIPVATPGLTDIAANVSAPDFIFIDGFDPSNNKINDGGAFSIGHIQVAGENGQVLSLILGLEEFTDIQINKTRLTAGPFINGGSITYQIELENLGNATATDFRFLDGFINLDYVSDTCNFKSLPSSGLTPDWAYYDTRVASLAPGMVLSCTMEFTVNGEVGDEIRNLAYVATVDDYNQANNHSESRGVFIQAPE